MKSTELTNEITPYIISLEPDQVRFGDRKIAAWSGPRRVFFQNNYLIFFQLLCEKPGHGESDRVTAVTRTMPHWFICIIVHDAYAVWTLA